MSWTDFDELAHGEFRAEMVHLLRRAERSRRLLLLRALMDDVAKSPDSLGPLPPPDEAWDLLARVDAAVPAAFDFVLAHPYTGSWAGYTIRLLRKGITGVCPLWMHAGHVHAIAAAAAIRAGLNFRTVIPLWKGCAFLPTLGLARLPTTEPHSVAEVCGDCGRIEIRNEDGQVVLADPLDSDTPGWWNVRQVTTMAERHRLTVRLDDVDPYRGLHEPVLHQRLEATEISEWHALLADAWQLLICHLPDLADALSTGLDSIVPMPAVPFQSASASTGEAFGSALVARPDDGAALAESLVHEFHHIVLGGVLHLTSLYDDDPSDRFYVPWRPDPRPLSGALTGLYAFFGVAAFWRKIARVRTGDLARRATFEFALARTQTWLVLRTLRDDTTLTEAGRRFVDGIASRLEPWQDEVLPDDLCRLADAIITDHYAGFRMRHVRPSTGAVTALAEAWLNGQPRPPIIPPQVDAVPTPVQDGVPSNARADLIRLGLVVRGRRELDSMSHAVPDATTADLAYATGRFDDAAQGYRAELTQKPDRVPSWVGLGLALTAIDASPAARALIRCPELVRAVRRRIGTSSANVPSPERLATWIGHGVC